VQAILSLEISLGELESILRNHNMILILG